MSPGHWPLVGALPRKGSKRTVYLEDPVLLDTETSNNYDPETGTGCGWIYQWAFNFGDMDCIGTYASELIVDLMNATAWSIDRAKAEEPDLDVKCLAFVHNLSYDIQYLMADKFVLKAKLVHPAIIIVAHSLTRSLGWESNVFSIFVFCILNPFSGFSFSFIFVFPIIHNYLHNNYNKKVKKKGGRVFEKYNRNIIEKT